MGLEATFLVVDPEVAPVNSPAAPELADGDRPHDKASLAQPVSEEDSNNNNKEEEKEPDEGFGDEGVPTKGYNSHRKFGIFDALPFQSVENARFSLLGRSRQIGSQAYDDGSKDSDGSIILAWMQSIRAHKFPKHDEDAGTATTVGGSDRSLSPQNECTTLDNTYTTSQNQLSEVLGLVKHFIQDRISTFKRNILHLRTKSKDSTFERNIQTLKRRSFGNDPTTDTFKRNIERLRTISQNSNS